MNHITQEQALASSEKTASIEPDNWAVECHDLCNAAIEWHIAQQTAPTIEPVVDSDIVEAALCIDSAFQHVAPEYIVELVRNFIGHGAAPQQAEPKEEV